MMAVELHFESTIERAYEPTAAALRAGPEEWLPGPEMMDHCLPAELEREGQTLRRIDVAVGAVQPFGPGLAVPIQWRADRRPRLYPRLHGALRLEPLAPERCRLRLDVQYVGPAGWFGEVVDRAVMHRVAHASVRGFLDRLTVLLDHASVLRSPRNQGETAADCAFLERRL
jgi:hypothetical protein